MTSHWPGSNQAIWQQSELPKDELLPHVGDHLNAVGTSAATAWFWEMSKNALRRVTLGTGTHWTLHPAGKTPIGFQFDDIRLVLFHLGVGFLLVGAKPISLRDADSGGVAKSSAEDWLSFQHYFRFAGGSRAPELRADFSRLDPRAKARLDLITTHEPSGDNQWRGCLADIADSVMGHAKLPGESSRWWAHDLFIADQALPYSILFFSNVGDDRERFSTIAYRARNFFHGQQELHPSIDLNQEAPEFLIYAHQQVFWFSIDGGGFLACDPPENSPFFHETLPNHLANHYLLLFLLALYQRFALMHISRRVADEWPTEERVRLPVYAMVFKQISVLLLLFTARGQFVQVMQRSHHHVCYRRWLEVFQIDRLYKEVKDEVDAMNNYLSQETAQQHQRSNDIIAAAVSVFAAMSLVFGYLGVNMENFTSSTGLTWWLPIVMALAATAVVVTMYLVALRVLEWSRGEHN